MYNIHHDLMSTYEDNIYFFQYLHYTVTQKSDVCISDFVHVRRVVVQNIYLTATIHELFS
jgi:hypothetical protein